VSVDHEEGDGAEDNDALLGRCEVSFGDEDEVEQDDVGWTFSAMRMSWEMKRRWAGRCWMGF